MGEIVGWTEEGVGGGKTAGERLTLADKQQRGVALLAVMDVSLARGRVRRSRTLRLPVEEFIADCVVLVHRGR